MANHIHYDRAGENQHVVFAMPDIHAVGVRPGEPPFGDLGDGLIAAIETVFPVQEIARGFQIIGAGNINGKLASEQRSA